MSKRLGGLASDVCQMVAERVREGKLSFDDVSRCSFAIRLRLPSGVIFLHVARLLDNSPTLVIRRESGHLLFEITEDCEEIIELCNLGYRQWEEEQEAKRKEGPLKDREGMEQLVSELDAYLREESD